MICSCRSQDFRGRFPRVDWQKEKASGADAKNTQKAQLALYHILYHGFPHLCQKNVKGGASQGTFLEIPPMNNLQKNVDNLRLDKRKKSCNRCNQRGTWILVIHIKL